MTRDQGTTHKLKPRLFIKLYSASTSFTFCQSLLLEFTISLSNILLWYSTLLCFGVYFYLLPCSFVFHTSILDNAKGQSSHRVSTSKLTTKQQANLKSPIKDTNKCLNGVVMLQMNFPQEITFDTLYTNRFLFRIRSRTLNVILYDKDIEQVIIDLEFVLRPWETIRMNWHYVTKKVTKELCSGSTFE